MLFYLAISRTFISFFLIFNSVISKSFEDVIILLLSLIQVYHPQKHVRTIFNGLKSIFQYLFYLTMIHIILVKFFKYSAKGVNIRFRFKFHNTEKRDQNLSPSKVVTFLNIRIVTCLWYTNSSSGLIRVQNVIYYSI